MGYNLTITIEQGKYEYRVTNGTAEVLRHGQSWRDVTGDNFILCMAQQLDEALFAMEHMVDALDTLVEDEMERDRATNALGGPMPYIRKAQEARRLYERLAAAQRALEPEGDNHDTAQ